MSTQKFLVWHGTSKEAAASIMKTGFKESREGQLGRGVYLAGSKDKARNFALAARARGNGGGAPCILCCELRVRRPKYIRGSDRSGSWRKNGHDAVRCDRTEMSKRAEWCVADPKNITVIEMEELDSSGDERKTTTTAAGRSKGYVDDSSGTKYFDLGMLSTEDLFGQASRPTHNNVPSTNEFIRHRLMCDQGCSWCTQFKYEGGKVRRR